MTSETTTRLHDLAVSIHAGDVPAEHMAELRSAIEEAIAEAVASVNESFEHVGLKVWANVDYDGRYDS